MNVNVLVNGEEIKSSSVEYTEWERNGTESTLVIFMRDGTQHRVGGVKAYEIERKLIQGE
jgi:hypothetical protein